MDATEVFAVVLDVPGTVAPEGRELEIRSKIDFSKEFDFDSLDLLNFATGLHQHLGIEMPEADSPKLSSSTGASPIQRRGCWPTPRSKRPPAGDGAGCVGRASMRITFLGTPGNIEIRHRRHRRHSALLIQHCGRRLMVDCGADWLGRVHGLAPDAII